MIDLIKKHKIIAILIASILILILLELSIKHLIKANKSDINVTLQRPIRITDRNTFFTIQDCVTKYFDVLSSQEYEKVLNLIDKEYIKEFNITIGNIEKMGQEFEAAQIVETYKVYKVEEIYYAFNVITPDILMEDDEIPETKEYCIGIVLNETKNTFTVIPDGYMSSNELDSKVKNEEIDISIKKYSNYANYTRIEATIYNKTNDILDLSKNINLFAYEDGESFSILESQVDLNTLKVPSKTKQDITLVFENEVCTPKTLIWNYGTEISVDIIKNLNTKK